MNTLETYESLAHHAVEETAQSFHLEAENQNGLPIFVPCSYQIEEPGFRPHRAGKGSADELQTELDNAIQSAKDRGIDPGIEGEESIRKLTLQLGLGIDCSNFAFRALTLACDRLDLGNYADEVYRPTDEIKELHSSKDSWAAKDKTGKKRNLTDEEMQILNDEEFVPTSWIAEVFRKDLSFIIGAKHIASDQASVAIGSSELMPCDLIAFQKAGSTETSHLGVVSGIDSTHTGRTKVDFWHAWHTRDFHSGLRKDEVMLKSDDTKAWSHEGLADPTRYSGHHFRRTLALSRLVDQLRV